MLIKTGDKVRVISGKDRGQEGTVKKVISLRTGSLLKVLTRSRNTKNQRTLTHKAVSWTSKHQSMLLT